MKKAYLSVECGYGMDWHDYYLIQSFLKGKTGYAVSKDEIDDLIVEYISSNLPSSKEYIDGLKEAIHNKTNYDFPVYSDDSEHELDINICSAHVSIEDGKLPTVCADHCGVSIGDMFFYLVEIEEGEERYYVSERFLAPMKGVPCVDRMYHMPFTDLHEAEVYKEQLQKDIDKNAAKYKHEIHEGGVCPSGIRGRIGSVAIIQICNLEETEWYKCQKEAIRLMEKTKTGAFDTTFIMDVYEHIKNMKSIAVE